MKQLTDYIIEKANFLVKKHIKKHVAKIVKLIDYWEEHNYPEQAILVYNIDAKQFDKTNLDKDFSMEEMNAYIIASGTEKQLHDKFPTIETDDVKNIKDNQSISKITDIIELATNKKIYPNEKWIFHYVSDFKRILYYANGDIADTAYVQYMDVSDFI